MVVPRAAKRRRVVEESSDAEEENIEPSHLRPKTRSGAQNQQKVKSSKQIDVTDRSSVSGARLPLSQSSTTSAARAQGNSPSKSKVVAGKSNGPTNKGKTLYSFFNAATQKLQESSEQTRDVVVSASIDEEDIIDISDDDNKAVLAVKSARVDQDNGSRLLKKRPLETSAYTPNSGPTAALKGASQKYRKALDGKRESSEKLESLQVTESDKRPWAETYGPSTLEELTIHKKKVADVRQWLQNAIAGQPYKTLLILKGPAGCGKTTTLNMLAKDLGFDIVEWKNPATSDFLDDDYISVSTQFDDFLQRGRQFSSLDMVGSDGKTPDTSNSNVRGKEHNLQSDRQVMLVEDFPYAVMRMGMAVNSLRSTLLQCLASKALPGQNSVPIVLIITESIVSSNSNASDNFTAHRLLGSDILHHPATAMLEFNPVAPTFITKALNLVIQKHRRQTGVNLAPDQNTLKAIAEIGDVRNAVATLEFLSSRTNHPHTNHHGTSFNPKSRSGTSKSTTSEASNQNTNLALISLRESTIGLFHAVGKVVYNKRIQSQPNTFTITSSSPSDSNQSNTEENSLPPHLSQHARSLVSEVSISTLIDETGTDTSTFLFALHENYALSCTAPIPSSTEATLDSLNSCLDALSNADVLLGPLFSSRNRGGNNRGGGTNEGLRQDELAFHTGVAGILHALPSPVKRQAYSGALKSNGSARSHKAGGLADAHRMFYPTGLKIWRQKEEILGLLDVMVEKAMLGTLLPTSLRQIQKDGGKSATPLTLKSTSMSQPGKMTIVPFRGTRTGIETWRRTGSSSKQVPITASLDSTNTTTTNIGIPISQEEESATDTPGQVLSLGSGTSARHDMLLERLPYLARIYAPPSSTTHSHIIMNPTTLRQIEQITRFTGVGTLGDDDDSDLGEENAQSKGAVPWVSKEAGINRGTETGSGASRLLSTQGGQHGDVNLDVKGLVLSDDDIEDD